MRHIENMERAAFLTDELRQDAAMRQIEIIGEAVKRLSDTFRRSHPEIPWRLVAGMRDRLIHDYDDVDLDEVWRTLAEDLPGLLAWIERKLGGQTQ